MWTSKQLQQHQKAAKILKQVVHDAFEFIRLNINSIDEYQLKLYIQQKIKEYSLTSDKDNPIVAFGQNTSFVHYFASQNSSRKILNGDLVLIDLWARLNEKGAPFADITWMAYCGKDPKDKIVSTTNCVFSAREAAINYLKAELEKGRIPSGCNVDDVVLKYFRENKLQQYFLHSTGHPLGFTSAHGREGGGLWQKNKKPLKTNISYTIEPGLYFEKEFGVRSEINFYINENLNLIVTTEQQKSLEII